MLIVVVGVSGTLENDDRPLIPGLDLRRDDSDRVVMTSTIDTQNDVCVRRHLPRLQQPSSKLLDVECCALRRQLADS
jgi:hypothetical protein